MVLPPYVAAPKSITIRHLVCDECYNLPLTLAPIIMEYSTYPRLTTFLVDLVSEIRQPLDTSRLVAGWLVFRLKYDPVWRFAAAQSDSLTGQDDATTLLNALGFPQDHPMRKRGARE